MSTFVRQDVADAVATVTIDRPDVHNAFNEVVIEELTAAMHDLGERDDVRVIVLAAAGKSFSAGADMNWMKRMVTYSMDENIADATAMADMLRSIRECPRPVIARVQGAAFGGGVGLTAACDLAVAMRSAMFALTEVKLGILPAVISPYVVEKIGPGLARRYALTAERFDADDARRAGLVSVVVETEEELDTEIDFFVKLLLKNGPEAIAHCKRVLREIGDADDWDARTLVTAQRIAERRVSAEGQEGLHAFLEKRKPSWDPAHV